MATYYKPVDLYKAQVARFARLKLDYRQGHEDMAQSVSRYAISLMTGGSAKGKARLKLLRQLGNPFGRGASASLSTPAGRFRGASRDRLRKAGMRGQLKRLPIGEISGRLRRNTRLERRFSSDAEQTFDLVYGALYAKYILSESGTKKLVGTDFRRKVFLAHNAGRKAFYEQFGRKQRKS